MTMAQDDMYVVMCKTIAYLYECMKAGAEPDGQAVSAKSLGIPHSYWARIMQELVEHGILGGVSISPSFGGIPTAPFDRSCVTMEGAALAQKSMMISKARSFLQEAKAAVPFE